MIYVPRATPSPLPPEPLPCGCDPREVERSTDVDGKRWIYHRAIGWHEPAAVHDAYWPISGGRS